MDNILIFLHKIGPYHHARFNALAKLFEVYVVEIKPDSGEYAWNKEHLQDVNYSISRLNNSGKGSKLLVIINKLIKEIKPTFILTHGWSDREYLAAVLCAKEKGIPVVTTCDSTEMDIKRALWKEWVKAPIIKAFDGYVVAGSRSKKYIEKFEKSKTITAPYDVVDNEYFIKSTQNFKLNKLDIHLPAKYILCVSRFIEKKNLLNLCLAFSELEIAYSLLIIGSGELEVPLTSYVAILGCKNIEIQKFAQYTILPYYYAHASALIIPSLADQWGLVVNEAMASGLPVLASTRCGCADDLVIEGQNGFVFNPTVEGIKEAIIKFTNCSNQQQVEMGDKSKEIIRNYKPQDFAQAIHQAASQPVTYKLSVIQRIMLISKLYI